MEVIAFRTIERILNFFTRLFLMKHSYYFGKNEHSGLCVKNPDKNFNPNTRQLKENIVTIFNGYPYSLLVVYFGHKSSTSS